MVMATFEVLVTNDSEAEALTLDGLNEDQFGDITLVQDNVVSTECSVPQTLPISGSYTCTLEGKINGSPHTDAVTRTVSDNEGASVTPSDSTNVTFDQSRECSQVRRFLFARRYEQQAAGLKPQGPEEIPAPFLCGDHNVLLAY